MLRTIEINHGELEDKLIVPFYFAKEVINEIKDNFGIKIIEQISEAPVSGRYIPEYSKTGERYLRVQNIRNSVLNCNEDDFVFVDTQKIKVPEKIRVKEGDIVLSRTTSSPSNFGNNAIIPKTFNGNIMSQHVTRLRINGERYYISAFLNSFYGKLQLVSAGYGSTRLELTHDELKKVIVPEIDKKQKEIITSNVKKVLECEEKSFKLIKETLDYFNDILKIDVKRLNQDKVFYIDQEQITDTFCPYFYYPLFTEYIQTLKKKFKTIKLSQIIDIKSGDEVGSENYSVSLKKNLNDIPFIRTSDIINYEVDSYPDYYVVPEIQSQLSQDIKDGDVLFTKDGKIGLSGMITSNDDCILASGIAYMRLKQPQKICPEYVFICLSSNIGLFQAMQRTVTSSTLPHLRPEHILEFEIPLIDEEYQQEITKKVKQAFKLKDEKKTLIRETKKILEDNIDKKIKVEFNNFE
jgi:type I restriction enzyme S subunit